MSGYFGGGGGGGTPTEEVAGSILWFRSPAAKVVNRTYFGNGQIAYQGGLSVTSLFSGTADGDGVTGAGGFTESEVSCNCWYDTAPSADTYRGYNHLYVSNTNDPYASNGIYGRSFCRFAIETDQYLLVGFGRGQPEPEATTNAFVGFSKRPTDTNWQVATCVEGTGWTYTDTGVAWAAGDWHQMEIEYRDVSGTRTLYAWIDGVLVATITTNLPTNTDSTFVPSWWVGTFVETGGTPASQVGFISNTECLAYNSGEGEAYARDYS
jgi:hypothetical protein